MKGWVLSTDYDGDPERYHSARRAVTASTGGEVFDLVAERLSRIQPGRLVDIGCGDGPLFDAVNDRWASGWVGLDIAPSMARAAPRPTVVGDATCLPFRDGSVAAVAALWMLYELDDPMPVLREAARVLRPGGILACCTARRDDSPELADHFDNPTTAFDAEEAPDILARVFAEVEVTRWNAPLVYLADTAEARAHLLARGASDDAAARVDDALDLPLRVTRRGSLLVASQPRDPTSSGGGR